MDSEPLNTSDAEDANEAIDLDAYVEEESEENLVVKYKRSTRLSHCANDTEKERRCQPAKTLLWQRLAAKKKAHAEWKANQPIFEKSDTFRYGD